MALIDAGHGDREIAALTGVGRNTVNAWRLGRGTSYHRRVDRASTWLPGDAAVYCYLLGAYLGDGHITVGSLRSASLVVYLDAGYPAIVDAITRALETLFPEARSTRHTRVRGSVAAVQLSDPALPYAFPQHGLGRKHTRAIQLSGWQRELTHAHPRELIRGLIHSDGCRCVNRFKTKLPSGRGAEYEYPRYFFSNLSEGIRTIFCEHCALLGIRCTQSNARNISVSHRKSVALLDEFVEPKS